MKKNVCVSITESLHYTVEINNIVSQLYFSKINFKQTFAIWSLQKIFADPWSCVKKGKRGRDLHHLKLRVPLSYFNIHPGLSLLFKAVRSGLSPRALAMRAVLQFLQDRIGSSVDTGFPLFLCTNHWKMLSYLSLLFFGTLHSDGCIFPFLLCLSLLFFS